MTKEKERKPIMSFIKERQYGFTISSGTLRMEDLLSAALNVLESVKHDNTNIELEIAFALKDEEKSIDLVELWDKTSEYMNTLVKPPWYFGNLEGDGAEVGFFLDPDYVPDFVEVRRGRYDGNMEEQYILAVEKDTRRTVEIARIGNDLKLVELTYNAGQHEGVMEVANDIRFEILDNSDTIVPEFSEVRIGEFDEDAGYPIDVWFTDNEWEPGVVAARVYPGKEPAILHPGALRSNAVLKSIEEAKKMKPE